jgi:HK97 family phage major capsid protein
MKLNALSIAVLAGLRIYNDAVTLDDLQNKLLDLTDQAQNIQARADAESRQLTDDERTQIDNIFATFEDTEGEIDRRKSIDAMKNKMATPNPRRVQPDDAPVVDPSNSAAPAAAPRRTPRIEAGREDTGKWGFRSFGEFLMSVKNGSQKGASADPRLMRNAPSSYGSEGVGADGGFAVPPDFRTAIMTKVMGEESLLVRTDQQQSSSNTITFPADETTPWQSSGGIQAYWESEGGQKSQSKPALAEKTVKLNKLIALVPLTDELLEDAPAMASYVNRKAPEKIAFKINDAILNGTGVGQPMGILSSAGTIEVAAESGQVADSVVFQNIEKLYHRLTPSARRNAFWMMNPDVEQQLGSIAFPGTSPSTPVYLPPGGLSAAPYGMLKGRPIIPTEACPALGDAGDIVFGDLQAYLSVLKTGGIRSDVSIHLFFDYDVTAFRFVLRVGGQPWWNSAITGFQSGTQTRGFFAKLGERA